MTSDTKSGNATPANTEANAAAKSSSQPLAPETRRTFLFAAGAAACLAITGIIEWSSRPAPIEEFGRIGEEFYADFTDPTQAASLEVYVFDTDKVQPLDFRVQRLANGRWVIPSHHNYPADAQDQLAKTASSIIGITRGAMVTRWEADHAQFGVVNPKQDTLSVGDVEGVGRRITLRGEDDSVLVDYVVGDKLEGESDQYYVRKPDEDEVYIASLEIDLSTKFSDWIETDLLEVDSFNVTELTVNDYSFDETQGPIRMANSEISRFYRETSSDDWKLDGLDDETLEVNKDAIRETVDTIGDLQIAGVRPKQQGLTPDLQLDREKLKSQRDVDRLQSDLLTRGFLLQPGEEGDLQSLRLIAREGEMYAATNEGLVYRLHFGRAFAGSQEELETGFPAQDDGGQQEQKPEGEDAESGDGGQETESKSESGQAATDGADDPNDEEQQAKSDRPGRYVFVRVDFDKKYLGEEPTEPVEPEMPVELKEPAGPKEDEDDDSSEEGDNENADENPSEQAEGDENKDEEDPLAKARREYEDAKQKYDSELQEYKRQREEFDQKIADGEKKAEELNRRFAEWYYVIPGDSYDKLKLSRADLVQPKETPEEEGSSDNPAGTPPSDPGSEQAAANQAAADKFLAENKEQEGVVTTDSGLQYEVIAAGEGEPPSATSQVKVKYKGTLLDGTVFDESGDSPVEFGVNQLIKGWQEALQLMKPGAKWKLYVPPDLAYGETGSGAKIGPNTALIFELELLSVE